jgi:taurine--2-oxoglutarate transaminase
VNSGYVPLGGVVIKQEIADTFRERVYQGGLTYSGHPLACATAVASINIFEDEGIIENARMIGDTVIGPALEKMSDRQIVGEVRGLGVFWAIELVADRTTREPVDQATMGQVAARCKERGLWPFIAANRIHVVPPCNISVDDCQEGLAIIDDVLASF